MNETIELCRKLKELGLWKGKEDPKKFNEELAANKDMDGYYWRCFNEGTILEEWIPNPGRRALMKEIEAKLGTQEFDKQILKGRDRKFAHQLFSHEDWMRILIKINQ